MAVRMGQYGRQMDKPAKKGIQRLHRRAVHKSSTVTPLDKFDRPSLTDRALYKVAQVQTVVRKKLRRKKKK